MFDYDRVVSADDLFCDETMLDSEPDASNDSLAVDGTELLQIQLRARTEQICRSLGVRKLPKTTSSSPRWTSGVLLDSLQVTVDRNHDL